MKWVTPPSTTTDLSKSMARSIDFSQRGTHMPGSMYGEAVASSITTGKAQHESMMPTGSIIEYVQGNIGDSWERLNEMALDMTQALFANRKVVYFGRQYKQEGWAAALERPERFMQTIKGSDLQDWARQELSFQPLLNMHEKVVMGLQLAGGGLVSKRWQRDQIGIVDNNAMQQEILGEMQLEQQLAALMGMAQQGAITPDQIENWFLAMEKGGTAVPPQPAAGGPGAPGMPIPAIPPPGSPGMPMPPGPAPAAGPPAPQAGDQTLPSAQNPGDVAAGGPYPGIPTPPDIGQEGEFTLPGAVGDFSRLKKVKGRIFLVGEIVQKGSTDGPVEVDVTNPIDKSTILNGLPDEYHGQIQWHTVSAEPSEPHVEVGPGKTDGAQGGGPVVDHPHTIAAQDPNAIQFSDMPISPQGMRNPPMAANYPKGGMVGSLRS